MKKVILLFFVITLLFSSCEKEKKESKKFNPDSNETLVFEDKAIEVVETSENEFSKNNEIAQVVSNSEEKKGKTEIDVLRQKHTEFLNNSPFKQSLKLTKSQRKASGIPPKKYYEMEWELTMDPEKGRPTPEKLIALKKQLNEQRLNDLLAGRTPGDASDNNWVERGPNNVAGRTRGLMFDPNDASNETVFAGGVSGGLWKNTNISNANASWTRVNIPENLSVSSISYDPNNTSIFYVGTGESYIGGDVNGDGLWKSTDAGTTWTKVFGGINGATNFQSASSVTVNSPAGIATNYASFPTTNFGTTITTAITANVVLVDDSTAEPTLGCNNLTNGSSLSGKIALIRRGTCTFVAKVKNAQNAGAIAVIMMNNIDGQPIPMGGEDPTISIPSVMISKADGDIIQAALSGGVVNVTLNPSTSSFTGNIVPGIQHINDVKVRNNGGISEVYVAAGDTFYSDANATTFLGGTTYGLYKSIDGGLNWTEISLPLTVNNRKHCPNNIEFGSDNKIWLSTTRSVVYGDGGGVIFSSTDGVNFTQKYSITAGRRTQIAVSKTTPDKVYVLADISTAVTMLKTTNGFTSVTNVSLPVDADSGIPATDFTRGQAFYDLMLEVDPSNDEVIYTGGIDLFKSPNGGLSWGQFSHWYGGFGQQDVHADQHALAFANGASNRFIVGNDGGVYFSNNGGTNTTSRNKGFNVTQFYTIGVAPTTNGMTGDNFVAGAQDNGSQMFLNAPAGISASTEVQGGDGAHSFFDQDGTDRYRVTNYVYNNSINLYNYATSQSRVINSETTENGAFIAPMVLDSNLDILYSDYTTSTPTYQIRRYRNIKTGIISRVILTDALLTSSPTAFAVSKYTTTTTTLLVGTRLGKLLRLTNANATPTWTDITGPQFVGSISDVEYGASENEIFVTMHNYNVVSIWYTSNGGTTWQNKEGNFPDIPVKCILKNPLNANEVIIGTELGVWYTNTFNATSPSWNQSYNGMSNVKVTDLDLRNDNAVFAATYGRGVFSGVFTATSLSNENFAQKNEKVKVYPNPSNGYITIAINDYAGVLDYELYDLNGRQILSSTTTIISEKAIQLDGVASGSYLLKIKGDDITHTEKIIIQ